MNVWMNARTINMSAQLAEDVFAPELRNPRISAIRHEGRLARVLKKSALKAFSFRFRVARV